MNLSWREEVHMTTPIAAQFDIDDWNESAFDDRSDEPKVTRAIVTKRYSGDIEGSSITQWLMAYGEDGSATFVGLERISGVIDGHDGTLVLRHIGSYSDGEAKGSLEVLSGSGELASARGAGTFLAGPSGSVSLDLVLN
jgi:hypothetical protein